MDCKCGNKLTVRKGRKVVKLCYKCRGWKSHKKEK